MFLKTLLMKKKKSGSGDVDVLKHHHQAKSSSCQNSSKRVVTGGRHLAIRTNSEISVTLQTGMKKMNTCTKFLFHQFVANKSSNLLYQQ